MTAPASRPSRASRPSDSLGAQFGAMACTAEIRVAGLDDAPARAAIHAAAAEVRRIETTYSRYRADSIVSRLNAAAGSGVALEVDAETRGLLDFGHQLHQHSQGLFDLTSGVLRRAWDFRSGRVPAQAQIDALLPRVGWQHVGWAQQRASGRLALPIAGMELDFGGIGKEYAADRAAAVLLEHGARGGYVNLGGDIRVIGPDLHGRPWRLGIQHPRELDAVLGTIDVAQGALATSGDYERYIEVGGCRYCHILDPRSGWPAQGWQSITVLAPVCLAAGALTTVALLKGDDALRFLQQQGASYLAVDAAGRSHRSGL